ncbi:MAG: conserved putative rane protein [Chlamydiales bacterium]|jgi:drug/metabolite transporter (DMT)-like permease|nr:conserved putative rane protein [Chlamydiales bacterium]
MNVHLHFTLLLYKGKLHPMLLVILLYALFGIVFVASKTALEGGSPFFFVAFRMSFSAACLIGYLLFTDRSALKVNKGALKLIALIGMFNIYLTNALEYWALQYMSAARTCFIYSLSPFLSALFAYFYLNERLNMRKWVSMLTGFGGISIIFLGKESSDATFTAFSILSWPELAALGAACATVFGWVFMKEAMQKYNCSFVTANAYSMLLGGVIGIAHSLMTEEWRPIPVHDYNKFFMGAITTSIISNMICYNLYGYLLKKFTASFMSFSGLLSPLFTAIFEWLFLGTRVGWYFFAACSVTITSLYLFYKEELKQIRKIDST